MVYTHLLEINDAVLVLFHLILDGCNLGGKVLLTLDKTFEHTTRHIMSLLLHHFEIFLNRVKFSLKNLLLHFRRLRYLPELVMRHYDAVIVVVLDPVEEIDAVVSLETLFIGIENPCIGVSGLIGHGDFRHIRLHPDNHGLVGEAEAFHFMCRHTHYQRLAGSYLMITYPAAVLKEHPDAILLRLINGTDAIAVSEHPHVQIRECLMASVVPGSDETVEFVVIQLHQPFLKLRRLSLQPFGKSVAYFIYLGIGKLYRLAVRHLYVMAVVILSD